MLGNLCEISLSGMSSLSAGVTSGTPGGAHHRRDRAAGSRTRDQQWTLNHTGNWDRDKVDLNGCYRSPNVTPLRNKKRDPAGRCRFSAPTT
jgi:hypothetical protein